MLSWSMLKKVARPWKSSKRRYPLPADTKGRIHDQPAGLIRIFGSLFLYYLNSISVKGLVKVLYV